MGVTEGPMVYKKDGYYYLLVAEGGTGPMHAATLMRSTSVVGPYEVDPDYPMITTRNTPDHPLQNAGHGSLVETQLGDWYMVFICSRPLPDGNKLSPLGRETSLQKVTWTPEGWLQLAAGGKQPQLHIPETELTPHPFDPDPIRDDFDEGKLSVHWHTLRVPADESWLSLSERPGYLRLKGRESLTSLHHQSLVARRIQSFTCEIVTCVAYEPQAFTQMAGLVFYYDESDHYYLRISHDDQVGKHLAIIVSDQGQYDELDTYVPVPEGQVYLKAAMTFDKIQFFYCLDGQSWQPIGLTLYSGNLADSYQSKLSFTGAFVGLCAQDLRGTRLHADFDFFDYMELDA